jgi:alkanesulfonate monooxygenase SsuD/methylene tetrahydromethanopterin reductase-like flavin-dependent oxidoreductase (luciferase family)
MDLGSGAGWKRDEWLAYGYGFPETKERLARLGDDLGVISAMLTGDKHQHATYEGRLARVKDAINVPKPIQQPRVPIMVGGNGPNVTWRLAARYADELNLDGMTPAEVADALPVIAGRCERSTATRPACRVGPRLEGALRDRRDGSDRSSRRLSRRGRQPRDGPRPRHRDDRRRASILAVDARAAGVELA